MAGRIPQSFVNDLLGRVDIVALIDERVPLKKAGKNHQARCPFHEEKTPSFNVSPDKQFYHCFGCGASGTAITFLMEYERHSFVEAVETLAARMGMQVPREASARPQRDNASLHQALARAEDYFRAQLHQSKRAIAYLKSRGLSGKIAQRFGIGFAPDAWDGLQKALASGAGALAPAHLLEAGLIARKERGGLYDRFRNRIMFPIRDTRGRVIGFGGRLLGDGQGPKYLNSPETPVFRKGEELYGLFEARKATRSLTRILVAEGYMDVVALVQSGMPNAVATLGTTSSESHFRKLYRHVEEVVCCFDGDPAGRRAAWRALENALPALAEGRRLKFMFLPEGEDPDSLVRRRGLEDFQGRLDNATPAVEYLFGELAQGLDLDIIDDQARLASLATPFVQRAPEGALRELMRGRVRELTGLAADRASRPQQGAGRAPQETARRPSDRLAQSLLAMLMKRPRLLETLDRAALDAVLARSEPDLFGEVAAYLAEHPQADAVQILGRWSGDARQEQLLRLHERQAVLSEEQAVAEFKDGVKRLIAAAHRRERKQLLDKLREDPSSNETMTLFWELKKEAQLEGDARAESLQRGSARGNPSQEKSLQRGSARGNPSQEWPASKKGS